jgi:DNA-binding NtrC family response regulator
MDRLLIIDDNVSFLNDVESLLHDHFAVAKAATGAKGFEILKAEDILAVLLDLQLPDMSGLEILQKIHRDIDPHLPVIIVTEHVDAEKAVECMKRGAYDFIPKSFHRNVLAAKILKALERRALELSVRALQTSFDDHHDQMVFVSDAMKRIHYEVTRIAPLPFDVLLVGETGVGKDMIAYEIHRRSPRRHKPFIPLAMRALTESLIESELFGHEKGAFSGAERDHIGKLEAAHGGTVYIPEISSLNEAVQLKLLQFLQYKTISRVGQDSRRPELRLDVRVIMATNEHLEQHVERRTMRADFFHRITGVRLVIPSLRQRVDDIEPLAKYFLKKHSATITGAEFTLAPTALAAMKAYRWPGNVRELENAVKNAMVYSSKPQLAPKDFPVLSAAADQPSRCAFCLEQRQKLPPYESAERDFRRAYYAEVLRRAGGNVTEAAAFAGITAQGLRKVLRTLHIKEE